MAGEFSILLFARACRLRTPPDHRGIYIHTAGWREYNDFGPGSQDPHRLPDGTISDGSHGCVNTRVSDGQWYYSWAPVGMTVVMQY
ncbi:L,D-transpeptidase [Ktedonospora formicarum]|uniref:L,D-transpeptidase n=1 Tax=Ktedonospora formicarum TaxID=2778364 RepID=UPI003B75C201